MANASEKSARTRAPAMPRPEPSDLETSGFDFPAAPAKRRDPEPFAQAPGPAPERSPGHPASDPDPDPDPDADVRRLGYVAAGVMALAVAVAAFRTFSGAGAGAVSSDFQFSRARQLFLDGFLDSARSVGRELDSSNPRSLDLLDAIAAVDGANAALQNGQLEAAAEILDNVPGAYRDSQLVAALRGEVARREREASTPMHQQASKAFPAFRLPSRGGAFR